ncbi:TPA: type 1 fimbrial protein [Aeromonas hydrophila]|nr:type 1 fimbrial protein [Aeromonas hydrophila]
MALVMLATGIILLPQDAAAASLRGTVTVGGGIFDVPCDIAVGDREQSIRMQTIQLEQIVQQGHGPEQGFAIRLVGCPLARADAEPRFLVTFDGERDQNNFSLSGYARGVALMIVNQQGIVAVPGIPQPAYILDTGEKQLSYAMMLVSNQQQPRAGNYHTAIRFKIDYF